MPRGNLLFQGGDATGKVRVTLAERDGGPRLPGKPEPARVSAMRHGVIGTYWYAGVVIMSNTQVPSPLAS